ncbi:hypothetical protein V6N13_098513, partial [Hibiscus sabdariffa]
PNGDRRDSTFATWATRPYHVQKVDIPASCAHATHPVDGVGPPRVTIRLNLNSIWTVHLRRIPNRQIKLVQRFALRPNKTPLMNSYRSSTSSHVPDQTASMSSRYDHQEL